MAKGIAGPDVPRCAKQGCKAIHQLNSKFCRGHDPKLARERSRIAKAGAAKRYKRNGAGKPAKDRSSQRMPIDVGTQFVVATQNLIREMVAEEIRRRLT